MCEMVNFILRCAGTDLTVETEQVEDVDNVPDRISDLQDLYNEQGIFEYPLISKVPKFRSFQQILNSFFMTLIETFHHSSVLYNDKDLFENLLVWASPLSTAQCRPFRHTATIISLAMMTALCDVAREVTTTVSTSRKQLEVEKKKKTVNKGRVNTIQNAIQDGEKKLEAIDEFLKDGFDTVFVHRYRDIDPKIRAECMASLGQWLHSYREFFFEGQYLRYFGWTLSDQVAHTRLIVSNQLRSLYENKDNIAGLRSFTERFRARMVEMATQDADVSVRASVVEMLDHIRDAGLLEPEDIDAVGKLVFVSEPSVRKAAGRFFVANVQDVYDSTTEEVRDEVDEMFADEEDDNFESPKRSWLKFKCLADILQAYGEQQPERDPVASLDALSGTPVVSRFVLAAEAIYPYLEELSKWQSLASYLLYDHSQIASSPAEDYTDVVRKLYKMEEGQEGILLDVLYCAVKLRILDVAKPDVDKRGRRIKALADKIPEMQEEIAHGLTQIIPRLLKKFGAVPEAASSILRLEHLVDLDKVQDLQKDARAYSSLLGDINRQFLTHSDQAVLAEASISFVHAKTSDELKDALETRTQELWDDMMDTLGRLSQEKDVQDGYSLSADTLNALTNTATRISNLAGVIDCAGFLETPPSSTSKRKKDKLDTPFNTLILLSSRGLRGQDPDEEIAKAETELVVSSIRTLLFYFMWKVQGLTSALNAGKSSSLGTAYFEDLAGLRGTFVGMLLAIMRERSGLDDIRFAATTAFLDLQTLFGTIRHAGVVANNDEDVLVQARKLVHQIGSDSKTLIAKIHSIAEVTYAKKLHRSLAANDDNVASEPGIEDEPVDDDDDERENAELGDSDDDDETGDEEEKDLRAVERLRSTILAEQRLCELTGKIILAIVGRVFIDSASSSLKQKLLRNKSRLGHNYKEILSFLEGRRKASRGGAKGNKSKTSRHQKQRSKQQQQQHQLQQQQEQQGEAHGENGDANQDDNNNNVEEDGEEDLRARGLLDEEDRDEDMNDASEAATENNNERDSEAENEDEAME